MSVTPDQEWDALREAARAAAQRAYAPYSGYAVGAAARTTDGRIVTGCNVENASYGVGLCAECALVGDLHGEGDDGAAGGNQLTAFACVNGAGEVIMPCGRCRQLLNEFAAADFCMLTPLGVRAWAEVLPQAFGPRDLKDYRGEGSQAARA